MESSSCRGARGELTLLWCLAACYPWLRSRGLIPETLGRAEVRSQGGPRSFLGDLWGSSPQEQAAFGCCKPPSLTQELPVHG